MASPAAAVGAFPVPVFQGREWWNADDWKEAIDVRQRVMRETLPNDGVRLQTGPGFWLQAMARFPQLQLAQLEHVSTFWKRRSRTPIVEQVPGLGWDMFLQRFRFAELSRVGGAFGAAGREASDPVLVKCVFRCSGKGCIGGRYVPVLLVLVWSCD